MYDWKSDVIEVVLSALTLVLLLALWWIATV
jgi:hypothetical protein